MSDELFYPDKRIVSIDEAKRDKAKRPVDSKYDLISRNEFRSEMLQIVQKVNRAIPQAALAVGEKMYNQMAEETSAYLESMEHAIELRILAEIERRSLRGKIRRYWHVFSEWVMGYTDEIGLTSPITEPPPLKLEYNFRGPDPIEDDAPAVHEGKYLEDPDDKQDDNARE